MKIISLLLATLFLPPLVVPKWTDPVQLLGFGRSNGTVQGVYRDPTSRLNHVIASDTHGYYHVAVTDEGKVLNRTTFSSDVPAQINNWAAIQGDGTKLYLAYTYYNGSLMMVNFTQSLDSGNTWSTPACILQKDTQKYVADLLCIKETGRLFVLISTSAQEMKIASRAPGSTIFSAETLIADRAIFGGRHAKAAYSLFLGKVFLHVAFKRTDNALMYSRSGNNGATWSAARIISNEQVIAVTNMVGGPKLGPGIYIAYTIQGAEAAMLLYSDTHGNEFKAPVALGRKTSQPWTTNGLSICSSPDMNVMTSMIVGNDSTAEYALWNTAEMKPYFYTHPFTMGAILTVGLDSVLDFERALRNTTTFATMYRGGDCDLYFAIDHDPFPTAKSESRPESEPE